jgi:hypothetical protein
MRGSRRALTLSRRLGAAWRCEEQSWVGRVAKDSSRRFFRRQPMIHLGSIQQTLLFSTITGPSEGIKPAVVTETKILLYAAQEAERLLDVASRRQGTPSQNNLSAAINAADALLVVSSPSNSLANGILDQKSSSQIASLHRAFLELTSWCLDHIELLKESSSPQVHEQDAVILEKVLSLARRAHELALPFHLPLYQRLMELFATGKRPASAEESPFSVDLILEVSSWIAATLNAPVDAAIFRPCLCRLIESRRLSCALDLLKGMRVHHSIEHLDLVTITDTLLLLRTVVKEGLASSSPTNDVYLADASDIVTFLESSIVSIFLSDENALTEDSTREPFDENEMDNILDRMLQTISEEEALSYKSDEEEDRDPLDLVVHSILTKGIRDVKAKLVVSDLMKYSRAGPGAAIPTPRINLVGAFVDNENQLIYQAVELDFDEDGEDEWLDKSARSEIIYSRANSNEFPDVTAQVMHLNGGDDVLFTKSFENILWTRDFKEDIGTFDMWMPEALSDGETDSDDDDDSDEF